MKRLGIVAMSAVVVAGVLVGCGKGEKQGGTTSPAKSGKGTFYWVQALKGHPVHQMTQIAFKEGCRKSRLESSHRQSREGRCAGHSPAFPDP